MANRFLSYDGLSHFWAKLKGYFVKAVDGKGLSTNDLTNELKGNYDAAYQHSQAQHAPSDAEANVQADWNEADTSSDAYIKNKPSIPAGVTVDAELSDTSANPVQNKVVKAALDGKAAASHTHGIADIPGLQDAFNAKLDTSQKGQANGVATLGTDGKVPSEQLPSYVDDVVEGYYADGIFYSNAEHTAQIVGESGKIYVDLEPDAGGKTYRWSGSTYVEISSTDMVPITNEEIDQACV